MHTEPTISIIICSYNHAKYLDESIQSALNQSYDKLEIVVIDDGSIDETRAIAARYPSVKYVYQTNSGPASARNRGLNLSTGEYVVFLDADDRLTVRAVELGLQEFKKNVKHAFVVGQYHLINDCGVHIANDIVRHTLQSNYQGLLVNNIVRMLGAVMFSRGAVVAAGGFLETLRGSEDYELYLRLANRSTFVLHKGIVAEYRQHAYNTTKLARNLLYPTLYTLELQRPLTAGKPELKQALNSGLRYYKSTYGRAVLRQAILRIGQKSEWAQIYIDIRMVAKIAPIAFLALPGAAARKLYSKLTNINR